MPEYHAFHYGKMNQSFKMEDENNNALFEANLVSFRLLTASEYEFLNPITHISTIHKIGKTKTVGAETSGILISLTSWFKMDGKNCFDVLWNMGYSIDISSVADILHPEFALKDKEGNQVAVYKMNVAGEKEDDVMAIGSNQCNIVISTESTDWEGIFMGAFILGRI